MNVAVVILNFNGGDDTLACLESVARSECKPDTTLVIDNASDQPLGPLPERTIAIRTVSNLGFAGGMNAGLRRAIELGADYTLLLNNDTLVDPGMLGALLDVAATRPDAGIVSPMILYRDVPELIASAGWRFDPRRGHPGRPVLSGELDRPGRTGLLEVDASSGEAMLVSTAAVAEVGMLDEALYLRLEDIDWSLRMRAAGRRNYAVLDARLWHGVSRSSGGEHSSLNAYYHTRNILLVCARHAPMPRPRAAVREAEILLANLVHARRGARPSANARAVLAGWRDYSRGRLGARGARGGNAASVCS